MARFRNDARLALLLRIALEAGLFLLVGYTLIAMEPHARIPGLGAFAAPTLLFAVISVGLNTAFGFYEQIGGPRSLGMISRFALGLLIGLPVVYFAFALVPHPNTEWLTPRAVAGLPILVAIRQLVVGLCGSEVFNRRVLVLGLGSTARAVGTALSDPDVPSVKLVGYFPIHSREDVAVPAHMVLRSDLSLQAVISRERIDEVIVAVRDQRGAALPLSELLTCRLQGVRITDLPVFYERVRGEVPVEFLKASHLIFGEGFRLSPGREFRKRLFDVVVSLLLFIATLPVMAVTALAIKLESPGPLIYRQQRVGRGGKLFDLLKFRSMCVDAEQDGQPQWAAEGDSRVTRVGRFIRLARIDELPQLVNVLRGEMSFVGPRPERPYFVEQLARQIPFYATRLTVKPGITGWAQVRFPYGASVEDAASKLRFDLYYVKNHSFMLDIVILLETVRVVLFGRGSR